MTPPRIRLFVFDLDGTALGGHVPYGQFPRPFARLLDELSDAGIRWATNTTWSVENQIELVERSPVRSLPALLAGSTGRGLAAARNGRLIVDARHEKMVLARDKRFRTKNRPAVRRALLRLLREDLVERVSFNHLNQNLVVFTSSPGRREKAWRAVEPLLRSGEFYPWDPARGHSGTLLPKFMNKGAVVKLLQRRLRVRPEETLVAGDGINDLGMLDGRLARFLVCPANAAPAIKAAVRQAGGVVARKEYSWGVAEGVRKVLAGP